MMSNKTANHLGCVCGPSSGEELSVEEPGSGSQHQRRAQELIVGTSAGG